MKERVFMKTTKNTEGATGSAAPAIAQENPYLQPVANEQGTRPTNGGNGSVEADDEEAAALAELAAEEKKLSS